MASVVRIYSTCVSHSAIDRHKKSIFEANSNIIKMKRFVICLLFLLPVGLYALPTDTTNIFFIGNSFTYFNGMPDLVKGLADSAHLPMNYAQHTPGGVSVGDLSQDTLAHWMNPTVFNTLRQGNWDYVVLQDNQGRFIMDYGIFPPDTVSKVIEGHIKIQDSMSYYNHCSRMVLFAGWGPRGGYPPYATSGFELIDKIYANYSFLNDSMHEIIAPIGKAWERSVDSDATIDLWFSDSTHPSPNGSYLTACVIFSTIFKIDPTPINFSGGLDSTQARLLRHIAWQTVIDSSQHTGLAGHSVPVSLTGDTLTSPNGFAAYQWYVNGNAQPGDTNSYTTVLPGNYYSVETIDSAGCYLKSLPYYLTPPAATINLSPGGSWRLYPTPAHDQIFLTGLETPARIKISDIYGRAVVERVIANRNSTLNINELTTGTYILTVDDGNSLTARRFIKY